MPVTVFTKITINGREYQSLDEVPTELREAFQRALATSKPVTVNITPETVVFNGSPVAPMLAVKDLPGPVLDIFGKALSEAGSDVRAGRTLPDPDPGIVFQWSSDSRPIQARGMSLTTIVVVGLVVLVAGAVLYRLLA